MQEQNQLRYKTLKEIANETGLNEMSVRIKFTIAKKQGRALPPRRRIGRQFLYDKPALMEWLWQNSDVIRRKFEMKGNEDADADADE